MKYRIISRITPEKLGEMSEEQCRGVILKEYARDFPLAWAAIWDDVIRVRSGGGRRVVASNPNSPVGRQVIELLGTQIGRDILEERFGVAFGLYNDCVRVVARDRDELALTAREQIECLNGTISKVHRHHHPHWGE